MFNELKIVFKIAFRNLQRHWKIGISTILAIVITIISYTSFQGYIYNLKELFKFSFENSQLLSDFILENKDATSLEGRSDPLKFALTKDQQDKILEFIYNHPETYSMAIRFLNVSGNVTNGKTTVIFMGKGFDTENARKLRTTQFENYTNFGVPIEKQNVENGINIGLSLAKTLKCLDADAEIPKNYQDRYKDTPRPFECYRPEVQLQSMTESGQFNAIDATVTGVIDGIYKQVDDKIIQMPLITAQKILNTDKVSYISVTLKKNSKLNRKNAIKEFNKFLTKENMPIIALHWTDHPVSQIFHQSQNLMQLFTNFVVTVMAAIASMSIFITFFKLIKERTREIGTMRSLGFKQSLIFKIIMCECALLCSLGSLLGSIISVFVITGINQLNLYYKTGMLASYIRFEMMIVPSYFLYTILFVILLSILISFIVAKNTLNKKISEQLSYA